MGELFIRLQIIHHNTIYILLRGPQEFGYYYFCGVFNKEEVFLFRIKREGGREGRERWESKFPAGAERQRNHSR